MNCDSCPYTRGLCCRIYTVPVSLEDTTPIEFIDERREEIDGFGDVVINRIMKSVLEPIAQEQRGMRFKCIALGDDGKCTIYDHRPKACREWVCESHRTTLEAFNEWGKKKELVK